MRNMLLHSITTSRNVIRTFLIGVLILATASIALAQDLVPAIEIKPSISVEVGQEVFFSATGTTYTPNPALLKKARYEWDFGDGYSCKFGSDIPGTPYYYVMCQGLATVHYFMTPGDYRVTLTVKVFDAWDGNGDPTGSPIATNTTTTVVHVTGTAPLTGFEIQRANFNNRTKQYLYIQIPAAYRVGTTQLKVSLIGTNSGTSVLLQKSKLASEEILLLDHTKLALDNYVLQAQLLDADNKQITGGVWRDKFTKSVVNPSVTIDENNSFSLNGNLFFPIAPFMTSISEFSTFTIKASINALQTDGYQSEYTSTSWGNYLSNAARQGLVAMGPGRGSYNIMSDSSLNRWKFNHDVDVMATYVDSNKNSPAMFAWLWQDEPNLAQWKQNVYPSVLAAWAYVCHSRDPHHLTFNSLSGSDWFKYYSDLYGESPKLYDYLGSAHFLGGKKWMQDVFHFDIFPIKYRLDYAQNADATMGPYALYINEFERMKRYNKNLAPMLPTINPGADDGYQDGITHSAEQVYSEAWMNVIHGAKGIIWFQYFNPATIRWAAMKKFADQIKVLAPVVLGPAPVRTVTDTANTALNRVDTMIREKDGAVYVFAARVTEPDPIDGAKYTGVEPEFITVSFTISGLTGSTAATVVDEVHTHAVTDGKFTDTFAKNAVHIYKIAGTGVTILKSAAPRNLRVKKK